MRLLWTVLVFAVAIAGAASAQTPPAAPPAPRQMTMADVRPYMIGTWQNDADTRFTRELDADGKAFDRLLGEEGDLVPGVWSVFLGTAPPQKLASVKFDPKGVYLEIDQDGDVLLYQLVHVSHADMQMIYLQQQKPMSFSRLK